MTIRDITPNDLIEILELNENSLKFLSPLDYERLELLLTQTRYGKVFLFDKKVAAFILAFDQDAVYDSPNFLWFKERYQSFLYIDRIVVSSNYRLKGIANCLYGDIIEFAKANNYVYLTCEIDKFPPNPGSIRFHEKHKFVEVGTQWLNNGAKQVSLRERKVF